MNPTSCLNSDEIQASQKKNVYAAAFIITITMTFLFRVLSHQGMSQDGSWGMLKIFRQGSFLLVKGREFEGVMNQFVVVAGMNMSLIKDTQTLSLLTSIPTFGWPCLFLCLAIYWSKESGLLLVTTAVTSIIIDTLSSGEFLPSTLMLSSALLIFSLLQTKSKWNITQQIFLLSLFVMTIRCYEIFFIFVPVISWSLFQRYKTGIQQKVCLVGSLILGCAFLLNLFEYAFQTDLNRANNFSAGTDLTIIAKHIPMTIIVVFLLFVMLTLASSVDHKVGQIMKWGVCPLGVVLVLFVIFVGIRIGPIVHWYMRGPVIGLTLILMCTYLALKRVRAKNLRISISSSLWLFPCLINLLLVFNTSSGWIEYRSAIERQTNFPERNEQVSVIEVSADLQRDYSSTWATPSLSLMLKHNISAEVLTNNTPPYFFDFEGQPPLPISIYWKQNWCRSCIISEN